MIPSEAKRWRIRRILFRLGLFILVSPFALYFGPHLLTFGKWTSLSPADYVDEVQHCVPTVRAIKQYQRDTGHLPDSLDALVPKYLPSIPWGQEMSYLQGGTGFQAFNTRGNEVIHYDLSPGPERWWVSGYFTTGNIPVPPVTLAPVTQPIPLPSKGG